MQIPAYVSAAQRRFWFAVLAVLAVLPSVAPAQLKKVEGSAKINSVGPIIPKAWQRITIRGFHFGSGQPFNGCSDYIRVTDLTTNKVYGPFAPGRFCYAPILVSAWTDNEIDVDGFPSFSRGQDAFDVGDLIKIQVANFTQAGMVQDRENFNGAPVAWYSLRVTPEDGRTHSTRTPPKIGSLPEETQAWIGFQNETSAQDRERELHRNCSLNFTRIFVPAEGGNAFTDLCESVGKVCERVCDWEGSSFSCSAVSQRGRRDGTRIALCREKDSGPTGNLGTIWDEKESGRKGTWARRGTSNIFDADWNGKITAVLTISIRGDAVKIERRNSNDGNDCDYQGIVAPDRINVSGTYVCNRTGISIWQAEIQKK